MSAQFRVVVAKKDERVSGPDDAEIVLTVPVDIAADPDETTNLADSLGHADVLEIYKAKLKEMQKEMQDPWIMKWEYE